MAKNAEEILADFSKLPESERIKVKASLKLLPPQVVEQNGKKRTPGLNPGAFPYVAEDFDAPVDESFLLGKE